MTATSPIDPPLFHSVSEVAARLQAAGYITDPQIATCVLLAERLHKPLLIEGPAGCGKTELAKALAQVLAHRPVSAPVLRGAG
jgi:MoxR-like ATPase